MSLNIKILVDKLLYSVWSPQVAFILIYSYILPDILSDTYFDRLSDIQSDILPGIPPDTFYLTYILTF